VVVGHRGGRGPGWPPENTLAAFERARSEGAQAVELDVRLCASGEVVVLHDPALGRVTDGRETACVADLPWSALARVKIGTSEHLARLEDVLDWASSSDFSLNVEVKRDVPDRIALVRAVATLVDAARADVLLSSFDPFVLLALRLLLPRRPAALLTDANQRSAPALHALCRPPIAAGLHLERRQAASSSVVARFKKRGLFVGVWTVNDPDDARRLIADGIDLLITDEPGRIRGVVG
jgi:glycerophosphoryl diester phosphodiesterase